MLLSIDWDFYVGSREHVFDSPLWGSPDREHERTGRWRERARKRGGESWEVLREDFPLCGDPFELLRFQGLPCWVALSHESGFEWVENPLHAHRPLLNLDSHHDLYSLSGDPSRVRPGNWVGHALERGLVTHYTCLYPAWHAGVAVSEGYDLERTWAEIGGRFPRDQVTLERGAPAGPPKGQALWPGDISGVLLVQSPSWTSPLYDPLFLELAGRLDATVLTPPLLREW